jgi:pyruvate kinase
MRKTDMHVYSNDKLLKTKIVATVGLERADVRWVEREGRRRKERDEIYDPQGNRVADKIDHGKLLEWLIVEGVDVIRLNMSFATLQPKSPEEKILKWLNKHKNDLAKHVAVLGDLPGPKIRLHVGEKRLLKKDQRLKLDFKGAPRHRRADGSIPVLANDQPFEEVPKKIDGYDNIGDYISHTPGGAIFLIGDGDVKLAAESEQDGVVTCRVIKAGEVSDRPGLTIKYATLDMPTFQDADKKALRFLLQRGGEMVAYVGLSFVRNKDDVLKAKLFIEETLRRRPGGHADRADHAPALIAKIETRDALANIDEILDVADGIMVARGDLGLQLDAKDVPANQKLLIRKCNLRGKPIITATQMLDSMIKNMEPTRAEATDVFNAILDGTDAVMLSGETSKGRYPMQAVRTMVDIAVQAESYYFSHSGQQRRFRDVSEGSGRLIAENTERLQRAMISAATKADDPYASAGDKVEFEWQQRLYREKLGKSVKQRTTDHISEAACILSEGEEYKAIIAPTTSGRTARMISRFRPEVPILGVAHDVFNARKLTLSFGIYPLCIGGQQHDLDEVFDSAACASVKLGYITWRPNFCLLEHDYLVISTSGTPLFTPGTTNLIQIRRVSDSVHKRDGHGTPMVAPPNVGGRSS